MTPLRQRMLEDMQIRNLSPATQDSYLRAIAQFAAYFGTSPDRLGLKHIREYQLYLMHGKQASSSTNGHFTAAARFLYGTTLNRRWNLKFIPYPKREKKLPGPAAAQFSTARRWCFRASPRRSVTASDSWPY